MALNGRVAYDSQRYTVGPLYKLTSLERPCETYDLADWIGQVDTQNRLDGLKIFALNDAEAAGFEPTRQLKANVSSPLSQPIIYINHGTGIGGDSYTVCAENPQRLKSGRQQGFLGEFGEIQLEEDGRFTTWGNLVSGESIMAGNNCRAEHLDPEVATKEWERVGHGMALGLLTFMSVLGPSDIVIGGGVSHCYDRYEPAMTVTLDNAFANLSADSCTQRPNIHRVSANMLKVLPLLGAAVALCASPLAEQGIIAGER